MSFRVYLFLVFLMALAAPGCRRPPAAPPAADEQATPQPERARWLNWRKARPTPVPAPTPPIPPAKIWEEFSGGKAFLHVRKQVELGPRPPGSEASEQTRVYLTEQLEKAGWAVERQAFESVTPRGNMKFVNLIARFRAGKTNAPPPDDTQKVIVASHYDTKIFDTIEFVGAHDGASSTGAVVELARVLALDWSLARQTELVFFDGEEAVSQFSETDGLYGSRHYALVLRSTRRNRQFKFGILWDMIGDRDLTITLSPDSPANMARDIFAAAERLDLRSHFSYWHTPIWDDHIPLIRSGIPTINLIDFDYDYWHTADDTLDKLSPDSLEKVGKVTLYYLWSRLGPVSTTPKEE